MDQTTTFDAGSFTADGTARQRVPLPGTLFDGTVNVPVMHQVVKAFLANQRQANAQTKTRGRVTGGNQKPWKQKGTGRARQGSTRAPHWVGGGTVFGPTNERNYEQKVPRKVRQLGRKSALNARAREGAIYVIEGFAMETPKTAAILALVAKLGVAERRVLVLTDGQKPAVFLSARNLPNVHVMPYGDASTYHILWSDVVLIESGALGERADEPSAEAEAAPAGAAPAKTPRKRAARKTAAADATATPATPATPATEE
jgi:large subunit ribosomal protein L4